MLNRDPSQLLHQCNTGGKPYLPLPSLGGEAMRFSIKEGTIACDSAITTLEKFCTYHKVSMPSDSFNQEQYLIWFMDIIESKNLSAMFAVQETSELYTAKLRKERVKEQEFFKSKGTLRFKGNKDKLRSCNYCDSKFISAGGARKCDDCIEKTSDFYYRA